MKPGDIVFMWVDTGCFGMQPHFGRLIRVNRKTATVFWESGRTVRTPLHLISVEDSISVIEWANEKISKANA